MDLRRNRSSTDGTHLRVPGLRRREASSGPRTVRTCPLHDAGGTHRAGLPPDFAAAPEQRQRRNAADVVAGAEILFGFGVDLEQPHARFQLRRGLCVVRRHRPARSAPRRPEIHQHRNVVARKMFLETGPVHFQRFAFEQRSMAAAAGRPRGDALGWHAVHRLAMRTDDVQRVVHGCASLLSGAGASRTPSSEEYSAAALIIAFAVAMIGTARNAPATPPTAAPAITPITTPSGCTFTTPPVRNGCSTLPSSWFTSSTTPSMISESLSPLNRNAMTTAAAPATMEPMMGTSAPKNTMTAMGVASGTPSSHAPTPMPTASIAATKICTRANAARVIQPARPAKSMRARALREQQRDPRPDFGAIDHREQDHEDHDEDAFEHVHDAPACVGGAQRDP